MKTLTLNLTGKFAHWTPNSVFLDNPNEEIKIQVCDAIKGVDTILEVNGENKRLENGELVVFVKDKLSIVAKRYKDGKLLTKVKAPDIEIQTLDDGTIEVVDKFAILEREVKELAGMVEKMLIALSVLFKGGKHD
mgnify:FL=1|nr:MAG TPA: hypothetical protein [Caudoviricetes sp.]